ncbi:hypothetical protein, partial [Sphaerotilus sp.]|uniref:hypothetical protein n=1 Tax=Sphaerotilus sp. TaxID=2093942 RepID=UPI0034E23B99
MPADVQTTNLFGPGSYGQNRPPLNSPAHALPFSAPPPSIPVFTAALLEPLLAVTTFLVVHFAHGHVLDRAAMLLSI